MKIKEVTNPEEQLGLLRVIIDNTWSAIKQQADTQARQKAAQPLPKAKVKTPKSAPYAAKPNPLPKPKAIYQAKTQPKHQPTSAFANKAPYKAPQKNVGTQKQAGNGLPVSPSTSLANLEKDEMLNLPRGAIPKPF